MKLQFMNIPRKNIRLSRDQAGITLIELMIAMLIGLLLVAGAFQIFMSSKQTYRVQESLSRLQENGRFAAAQVQRELRMAGYAGCLTSINNLLDTTGAGYSDALFDFTQPMHGWEYSGTGPGDTHVVGSLTPTGVPLGSWQDRAGEALDANLQDLVVPGSDVFVVKRAEEETGVTASGNTPANANNISLTGNSGIPAGTIVLVTDCAGADVFQNRSNENSASLTRGATGSPGNKNPGTNNFSHQYSGDMQIFRVASDAYFIGIGTSGRPSLYRMRFGSGLPVAAGNVEELVEGVESMQLLYGEDTDGDRALDGYVTADAVSSWDNVIAMRIDLLLAGLRPALPTTQSIDFDAAGTTITAPADRRQRQVFSLTIALRNRLP